MPDSICSRKNYSDAENEVNAGLKIKSDDADLQLILAEIYVEKGNKDDAINELKKILAKDPNNIKANYAMA